jgi:hypothetical protein
MVHAMRMNSAPEAIKRLWNGACNEGAHLWYCAHVSGMPTRGARS